MLFVWAEGQRQGNQAGLIQWIEWPAGGEACGTVRYSSCSYMAWHGVSGAKPYVWYLPVGADTAACSVHRWCCLATHGWVSGAKPPIMRHARC